MTYSHCRQYKEKEQYLEPSPLFFAKKRLLLLAIRRWLRITLNDDCDDTLALENLYSYGPYPSCWQHWVLSSYVPHRPLQWKTQNSIACCLKKSENQSRFFFKPSPFQEPYQEPYQRLHIFGNAELVECVLNPKFRSSTQKSIKSMTKTVRIHWNRLEKRSIQNELSIGKDWINTQEVRTITIASSKIVIFRSRTVTIQLIIVYQNNSP